MNVETLTVAAAQTKKSKTFRILEWVAPSFIFIAIILHAFDFYPIGPAVHLCGAILWTYVGVKNKNGPVLLNFIPQIPIWSLGLLHWYMGK